ncbi:hypothetical protein M3P05_09575 [Sansalvadorimonas sp. 2012CJ34-2]|uniref:GCVT N-terminal domain-containing protein n=1 Tax=Parendozoicomonas callyspongiae TaxID=2942213 RepID=A0ABT0PFM5_9GAMM|nr:hypothetical protein [Sansalvadorimonas sp. 2012CJ34-2]MCL6270182.1 hypothetical protein [Sansalvadorimonas sp. 2012CJ34-2]
MTDTPALALTRLGHERLLTFEGQENRKFLQGQLTCDVEKLQDGQYTLGACCTAKGRMVANFKIFAFGDNLTISLPDSQLDALKAHLGKYAAFYRTLSINETSDQWIRFGLKGENAGECITSLTGISAPDGPSFISWNNGFIHAVPGHSSRYEIWVNPDSEQLLLEQLQDKTELGPIEDWHLQDILDGVAWVTEATRETYIPQHLNWQALEGISFSKGCYTGQEIVARMKYLGKLKSHLYRFTLDGNQVPETGAAVMNSNGSKSGEVVTALQTKEKVELLAVVRSSDLEEGSLSLADSGSTLNLQALPYEV